MMSDLYDVYAVDFDGTLCELAWPKIGEPNKGLIDALIDLKLQGDKLILWTCREDELLADAVKWCKEQGLEFDAVNDNLQERIDEYGGNCRKVSADYYIDDKGVDPKEIARRHDNRMLRNHFEKCIDNYIQWRGEDDE